MNTINEIPGAPSGSQVQGQGPEDKNPYFVMDGKLYLSHYGKNGVETLWNIAREICEDYGYYVVIRDGLSEYRKHYEEFCLIEMRNPDTSLTSWIRFTDDVRRYKPKCHDGIETPGYYDIPIVEVVDDVDFITDTETLADRFLKRIGLKEYGTHHFDDFHHRSEDDIRLLDVSFPLVHYQEHNGIMLPEELSSLPKPLKGTYMVAHPFSWEFMNPVEIEFSSVDDIVSSIVTTLKGMYDDPKYGCLHRFEDYWLEFLTYNPKNGCINYGIGS